MGFLTLISELFKLESIAAYLYKKWAAFRKAKIEANVPLTNEEEAEDLKKL